MAELFALRVEVSGILVRFRRDYRDSIFDDKSIAFESDELAWIVCQRTNSFQLEIEQDLGADSIIAEVGLESELFIRFHRV